MAKKEGKHNLVSYSYQWYNKKTGKWETHTGSKCSGLFCTFRTRG